jgi:thioredoxin-related protein
MVGADLDLDRVIQESNSTNRHTILFLHKDGCRFCERMIFDLEESNISETIDRDFLFIDINRDDDETISFKGYEGRNREFLNKIGVELYPTTIFVDNNGSFIHKIIGYRNPKKFLTILNYISSRAYKRVTFEEFEDESVTDR